MPASPLFLFLEAVHIVMLCDVSCNTNVVGLDFSSVVQYVTYNVHGRILCMFGMRVYRNVAAHMMQVKF